MTFCARRRKEKKSDYTLHMIGGTFIYSYFFSLRDLDVRLRYNGFFAEEGGRAGQYLPFWMFRVFLLLLAKCSWPGQNGGTRAKMGAGFGKFFFLAKKFLCFKYR